MHWFEIQITTTPEAEDAVAELFYEAGANGVAIENSNDVIEISNNPLVGYIDESLLERPENTSFIRAYFPATDDISKKMDEIILSIAKLPSYGLDAGTGELKILEVEEEDWADSWKKFFLATHVTSDIVVVPTWDKYKATEGEKIINLDPGMAFGTGSHETTKLCAKLLEHYCKEGDTVVDVGTGSGILSIIATILGAKKVISIDLDPVALRVCLENIIKNKCEDVVTVTEGNLLSTFNENDSIDIIVANILLNPILELIPQAANILKKNGIFICSGLIKDNQTEVIEKLEENSFNVLKVDQKNDWIGIAALKL